MERNGEMAENALCEECIYYSYDEEYDEYNCGQSYFDEDEYSRMCSDTRSGCPYFRRGDEYTIVRKQI